MFLPISPFGQFVKDYAGISQSFNEGFAEWISQLVYPGGSVTFGEEIGSPTYKTMAEYYDYSKPLTYLRPNADFSPAGIVPRIVTVCDQFKEREDDKAPAGKLCFYARKAASQTSIDSAWLLSQFSPDQIPKSLSRDSAYDPHYTGAPLFSFLTNLERETTDFKAATDGIAAFKRAAAVDVTTGQRPAYRKITLSGHTGALAPKEVPSLRFFFTFLRDSLSAPSKAVFDRLWTSYGMERGMVLFDADESDFVAGN